MGRENYILYVSRKLGVVSVASQIATCKAKHQQIKIENVNSQVLTDIRVCSRSLFPSICQKRHGFEVNTHK